MNKVEQLQQALKAELAKQAERSKANNKLKRKLQAKQAKKQVQQGDAIAEQSLLGLGAWAKFMQSEKGIETLYLWGYGKNLYKVRDLVKGIRAIDTATIEKSELNISQLTNRGKLLELTKEGARRKSFSKAQIKRILKAATVIIEANKQDLVLN